MAQVEAGQTSEVVADTYILGILVDGHEQLLLIKITA
jgi:hypothetical protein